MNFLSMKELGQNFCRHIDICTPEIEAEFLEAKTVYSQRFSRLFGIIFALANKGMPFDELNYSEISFEDIDWLMEELYRVPSSDWGKFENPTCEDLWRDKLLEEISEGIFRENGDHLPEFHDIKPVRLNEAYF